jgi:hypothetical protein
VAYIVNVFISHSWSYSEHYETLSSWIFEDNWNAGGIPIYFVNKSVPMDDPIHNAPNATALQIAIYGIINQCDVLVIPTGMYANYSEWIEKEIGGAGAYSRPILAVDLWGSQKTSSVVGEAAQLRVGWNKDTVVGGIWQLAAKV